MTDNQKNIYSEFEEQMKDNIDEFFNIAFKLTNSKKTAEKILLKTFKKALDFLPHLDDRINRKDWMTRILFNTYREFFPNEDEYDYLNDKEYYEISFKEIEEVLKKKNNEDLLGEIFNLNEKIRIALILNDVLKFNYEKSSDLLDIPEDVFALRLFYGRKKLVEKLTKT